MPDDYAFQTQPLPDLAPFGGNAVNNALSTSPPQGPDIPVAAYGTVDSPFGDPPVNGGGGGGSPVPTPPNCTDNWSIGTILTASVSFPCTGSTSTIQQSGVSFDDGSGNTATLGSNGSLQMVNGSNTLDVDITTLNADAQTMKINELDVCHMGAAGKRQFICGDAYAA